MKVSSNNTSTITQQELEQQEVEREEQQGTQHADGAHHGGHAHGAESKDDSTTSSSINYTMSLGSNTLDNYPTNPFGD